MKPQLLRRLLIVSFYLAASVVDQPKQLTMKLHQQLVSARIQKGFTQEELADLAGISVRTIQRLESGESIPRSYTVRAIALALGLTYEQLMVTGSADLEIPGSRNAAPDDIHFLYLFNLSCFSYLIIPWVHFLVPNHLLKKQGNLQENTISMSRKVIRQQISWAVALHLLLLLTLAYNLVQVHVFNNKSYMINYLWPFLLMYFANAVLILVNASRIKTQFNQLVTSECRVNVG